jgi:hypothetical protein
MPVAFPSPFSSVVGLAPCGQDIQAGVRSLPPGCGDRPEFPRHLLAPTVRIGAGTRDLNSSSRLGRRRPRSASQHARCRHRRAPRVPDLALALPISQRDTHRLRLWAVALRASDVAEVRVALADVAELDRDARVIAEGLIELERALVMSERLLVLAQRGEHDSAARKNKCDFAGGGSETGRRGWAAPGPSGRYRWHGPRSFGRLAFRR